MVCSVSASPAAGCSLSASEPDASEAEALGAGLGSLADGSGSLTDGISAVVFLPKACCTTAAVAGGGSSNLGLVVSSGCVAFRCLGLDFFFDFAFAAVFLTAGRCFCPWGL